MDVAVSTGETAVRRLTAEQLYRPTDLSGLTFSTTAELQPVDGLVGQARAVEAIRFGTQVGKTGFNLFVIGPTAPACRTPSRPCWPPRRENPDHPTGSMSIISPIRTSRSPSNFRRAARAIFTTRCTS